MATKLKRKLIIRVAILVLSITRAISSCFRGVTRKKPPVHEPGTRTNVHVRSPRPDKKRLRRTRTVHHGHVSADVRASGSQRMEKKEEKKGLPLPPSQPIPTHHTRVSLSLSSDSDTHSGSSVSHPTANTPSKIKPIKKHQSWKRSLIAGSRNVNVCIKMKCC